MEQLNLDGKWEKVENIKTIPIRGHYKVWRANFNYRKSNTERNCGGCVFSRRCCHGSRVYLKCVLQGVSKCTSSDIRVGYVCDRYQKSNDLPEGLNEG